MSRNIQLVKSLRYFCRALDHNFGPTQAIDLYGRNLLGVSGLEGCGYSGVPHNPEVGGLEVVWKDRISLEAACCSRPSG